jgi:hypothetical protein
VPGSSADFGEAMAVTATAGGHWARVRHNSGDDVFGLAVLGYRRQRSKKAVYPNVILVLNVRFRPRAVLHGLLMKGVRNFYTI